MNETGFLDEDGNARKKVKLCPLAVRDKNGVVSKDSEDSKVLDNSYELEDKDAEDSDGLDEAEDNDAGDSDGLDEAEDNDAEDSDDHPDPEGPSYPDPYATHFEYQLPDGQPTEKIQYQPPQSYEFSELGSMVYCRTHLSISSSDEPSVDRPSVSDLHLKKNLLTSVESSGELSPFQLEFLRLMSDYYDISYMQRTYRKGEALRKVYTLHILNHILKSRAKIIRHNSKLAKRPDEEYRDQGFTRPSAVVLVPFRHDCHRVVNQLVSLLPDCATANKKRFEQEYGPPPKRHRMKKKPQEYEQTFEGNTDEDFKIGLRIKNKSVTLYSEFYKSDLIIASPLGLRQVLGSEGERDSDTDFLSSVEILILDRVDILYLQNLVHLMHVLKHFNTLPKKSHGCDFSRVRMYACEGLAKLYRQTVLISSVEHRWFESVLLRNYCSNYKGYLCSVSRPKSLGINQVFVTLKMCFRLFDFANPALEFDDRFKFFTEKVLPDFNEPEMSQTLIYIPSYFDFVRLRNHFRDKELSATMICEYSSAGKVAEARNNFFKERRQFLLYTERAHFYNRYSLKGIQHLLFYQPPTYPAFFKDMQFALLDANPRRIHEEKSCTVVASRLDLLQLKQLVGPNRASRMLASPSEVFVQQIVR